MAVNPIEFLKMGKRLQIFKQQHPKFSGFIHELDEKALVEGTVIEIRATTPDGRTFVTNLRFTPEDIESVEIARGIAGKRHTDVEDPQ